MEGAGRVDGEGEDRGGEAVGNSKGKGGDEEGGSDGGCGSRDGLKLFHVGEGKLVALVFGWVHVLLLDLIIALGVSLLKALGGLM